MMSASCGPNSPLGRMSHQIATRQPILWALDAASDDLLEQQQQCLEIHGLWQDCPHPTALASSFTLPAEKAVTRPLPSQERDRTPGPQAFFEQVLDCRCGHLRYPKKRKEHHAKKLSK